MKTFEFAVLDDPIAIESIAVQEADWRDLACRFAQRASFRAVTTPPYDWTKTLQQAVGLLIQTSKCAQHQATTALLSRQLHEIDGKITKAEQMIAELQNAVRDLQDSRQLQVVPIVSLAPKPFRVLREIPILVESQVSDDNEEGIEYVCRFVEASVGTTGDTLEEAVRNMKDRLVSKFNVLDRMPSEKLGDGPRRQLAVLRSVMARAD